MSKNRHFQPTQYTLIVRDATGAHINGMGSTGDEEYSKKLAASILRTTRTGAASVEIYPFGQVPWQELQPLAVVTLDDAEVSDE